MFCINEGLTNAALNYDGDNNTENKKKKCFKNIFEIKYFFFFLIWIIIKTAYINFFYIQFNLIG